MATWSVWAVLRADGRRPPHAQRGDPMRQARPARRRRRRGDVDPFQALGVQLSLTRLERELERLQADDRSFARAHHLRAAMTAYDEVLAEACRLAGVTGFEPRRSAVERARTETELYRRGWSW